MLRWSEALRWLAQMSGKDVDHLQHSCCSSTWAVAWRGFQLFRGPFPASAQLLRVVKLSPLLENFPCCDLPCRIGKSRNCETCQGNWEHEGGLLTRWKQNIILKDRCYKRFNKVRRLHEEQWEERNSLRIWARFLPHILLCGLGRAVWCRNLSKGIEGEMDNLLQRAGEFLSCFSTHQLTYLTLSVFLTLTAFPSCQILDLLALEKEKGKKNCLCISYKISYHTSHRKTRPNMSLQLGSKDGILSRLVVNELTRDCHVLSYNLPTGMLLYNFPGGHD